MPLASFTYGKGRVRVLRVRRGADGVQTVHEVEAKVMLEGDFSGTYLTGENRGVIATDTMKNTVHALAQDHLGDVIEDFALALARHFPKRYDTIERATVELIEKPWDRYTTSGGEAHPHTFLGRTSALPFVRAAATRTETKVQSGVREMLVLKSTGSGFVGYPRCELTTLPETNDRIMATKLEATWTFSKLDVDFKRANATILRAMIDTYAREFSPSLQNTLYLMANAALAAVPEISCVHLAAPNKHYLAIDLKPFGRTNDNEIFLPTDEPHGQIEAEITR